MSASTKLSSSVKALCFLAESYPIPKTSKEIAANTGLNASKLRKLLSLLSKNNIVESSQGTKGGFQLLKSPKEIHFQEIYCSIEDRKAFHLNISEIVDKRFANTSSEEKTFITTLVVNKENKVEVLKSI